MRTKNVSIIIVIVIIIVVVVVIVIVIGSERVQGDSFLTLSLPRGLPLTSKIVWR